MELTRNIKTHLIVLKDGRTFPLTEQQYKVHKLEQEDKKINDSLEIINIDTKELVFDWKWTEFKEFRKRKIVDNSSKVIYCDYWTKHSLEEYQYWEWCKCYNIYGVIWWTFKKALQKLWYQIRYNKDITEEMQKHFLKAQKEAK